MTEKSPADVTTRVTDAVCVSEPLVPVMVNGKLPVGVVVLVVTVNVELPEVFTEPGLNDALAPAGSPLALRATVPVKPPDGVIVAV